MGFMPYNHIENDETFQLKNLMGSMKLCHTTQLKMMKPFSSRIFPQLLKGLCFRRNSKSKRIVGFVSFRIFNLSITSFACEEWEFQGQRIVGFVKFFAFLFWPRVCKWRMRNGGQCCKKQYRSCCYGSLEINWARTHQNTHSQKNSVQLGCMSDTSCPQSDTIELSVKSGD